MMRFYIQQGHETVALVHQITSSNGELNGFRVKMVGGSGNAFKLVRFNVCFDGRYASLVGDEHVVVCLAEPQSHDLLEDFKRSLNDRGYVLREV